LNYLAHAYLSFGEPKILVGNLIGDSVRGNIERTYEREIVIGIKLHREIDKFTDNHALVKEAQEILKPVYGKYSSVITDMYFDYFLGKYWKNYHEMPLNDFAHQVYDTIDIFIDIIPYRFLKMYGFMRYHNMLVGYGSLDGIRRAMQAMAKKTKFNSNMETAHIFLDENHEYFRIHFGEFFEDLVAHSKATLETLKNT